MTHTAVYPPTVTVAAELQERCDRCGAAGKLRIFLPRTGELAFCGHHANRFAESIRAAAEGIVVEAGFGWLGAAE